MLRDDTEGKGIFRGHSEKRCYGDFFFFLDRRFDEEMQKASTRTALPRAAEYNIDDGDITRFTEGARTR